MNERFRKIERDNTPGMLKNLAYKISGHLKRQSKSVIVAYAGFSIIVLGVVDYLTGFAISFAFFYLLPVSLSAWFVGRKTGLWISVLSAITWQGANYLAGETFSNPMIPFWNATTRVGFFFAVTFLLAELRRVHEWEKALSRTDFLTGALNHRAFSETLSDELKKVKRHFRPFSLAYIDLDNFKYVNDHLGHSTGDLLLQQVVQTMLASVRATDAIARLGGDEFAVFLPETDSDAARLTLAKLHAKLLLAMQHQQWPVTFSVGVMTFAAALPSTDQLISHADQLMYEVKKNGKNAIRYAVYHG